MSGVTILADKMKTPKDIDLFIETFGFTDRVNLINWETGIYQDCSISYAGVVMDYLGEFVSVLLEYKRASELNNYLKTSLQSIGVSNEDIKKVTSTVSSKGRLVGSTYTVFKFSNGCELLIALHSD